MKALRSKLSKIWINPLNGFSVNHPYITDTGDWIFFSGHIVYGDRGSIDYPKNAYELVDVDYIVTVKAPVINRVNITIESEKANPCMGYSYKSSIGIEYDDHTEARDISLYEKDTPESLTAILDDIENELVKIFNLKS